MSKESIDPNESIHVSILKRNLRLLKRMILGKKTPPKFLKILCWIFMGWSTILALGNSFIAMSVSLDIIDDNVPARFFYSYALLHIGSLLGVILMFRRKVTGLYIFALTNLAMPFWEYIITGEWKFEVSILIFSLISIGLFFANWNSFTANIKKKAIKKEVKKILKEKKVEEKIQKKIEIEVEKKSPPFSN